MPYTFTCLHCGNPFTNANKRKYCSKSCSYAHKRVQKQCVICGVSFELPRSLGDKLVTCGADVCKKAIKLGEHNPFYGCEHSSDVKSKISQSNRKAHREVDCTCGCGEKVDVPEWRQRNNKTNLFFVDLDHMHTWLQGENHWNYRGGNIYYGSDWKKIAQAVRERDKVCQECGKTPEENGRGLDVHHIIPVRVSHDNSMGNLVALCGTCHQKHQAQEQRTYPEKVNQYRVCLECGKAFIPEPYQKFCSEACHRKRQRQWEKKHLDSHHEYYQKRRKRITEWQQANKDRVNASHQQSRLRRRLKNSH